MRGTLFQKVNERIERHMQNRLAEFKLGRIVLHLLCCCQDRNVLWHWRGILREVLKGALLVSPASKCDATEKRFENAEGCSTNHLAKTLGLAGAERATAAATIQSKQVLAYLN